MNKYLLPSGITHATTIIYGEARYHGHLIRNTLAALPSLPNPFAVSGVLNAAAEADLFFMFGLLCRPP